MAWDIAIENESGDIIFSPSMDIAGVGAGDLLRQRVSMRCKIPLGTYIYDFTQTLGSTLHLVPRSPSLAQVEEARAAVIAALQPMNDEIKIQEVVITKTEQNTLQVAVTFSPVMTDPDVPMIDTGAPEIDAVNVSISTD